MMNVVGDLAEQDPFQAHVDFIEAARKAGFRACDCIIKVRNGPIIDPK
jgi:hypothetical protein